MKAKALVENIIALACIALFTLNAATAPTCAQGANESSSQTYPVVHNLQQDIVFHHLTIDDGLSHNSVYHVLQDRLGFIWATTVQGINRYDGMTFTTFKPQASGSSQNTPQFYQNMLEDRDGILWFCNYGAGLVRHDPVLNTWKFYQHDEKNANSLAHNILSQIKQDDVGMKTCSGQSHSGAGWWFGALALSIFFCLVLLLLTSPIAQAEPDIKVGAIFDHTGGINIYGIQQNKALHLAVDNINKKGGLLGQKLQIIEYDSQSDLSKYIQYANTLILRDRITVLFAGLTSSFREVIRPIIKKHKVLYFYGCHYEGGACDKYTSVTGVSASQQMRVLIPWAIKKYGPKIYIMGPDYNFGTLSATWVHYYAKQYGGEVLGEEFLPLTQTDYSATVQKIRAAQPDFVFTLPVGPNQNGFLEQFAVAGFKDKIGMVSTNYGSGNQQIVVSPKAGEGIVSSLEYFHWVKGPDNNELKKLWKKRYGLDEPIIAPAVNVWNAVHLWVEAVRKAGTVKTDAVIATLESGISFDGPNGNVTLRPYSHHLRQNIYIARGNRQHGFDIIEVHKGVDPFFEDEVCDLIKYPETAQHFTPEGH